MARQPHLILRRLEGELSRRKRPGFGSAPERDHVTHGVALRAEALSIIRDNAQRPDATEDPALVLKVNTSGYLDEAALAAMNMSVLNQTETDALIVFTPDPQLEEFRMRVSSYQGPIPVGQKNAVYAGIFNAIESMTFVPAEDRIGPRFQAAGFRTADSFLGMPETLLDVEIWDWDGEHPDLHEARVSSVVLASGGQWLSRYRGAGLFLARIRADGACVQALLSTRDVALVDLPPTPDIDAAPVSDVTIDDLPAISAPGDDAPCIGIIDSGLTAAHPLVAPALSGTFGVPPRLGDDDERGHGTAVAGLAVYGSFEEQLGRGQLEARFTVASAKVVDSRGLFDDGLTVPEIMETAIRRLHDEFGCQVVNISLGDGRGSASNRPSSWAATIDNLARELDLVVTVSAGNIGDISGRMSAEGIGIYPRYLTELGSRIVEPASALNAISVGSIAHANGLVAADEEAADVIPLTEPGDISPFSRCGFGHGESIKPDFVEYGGTAIWQGYNQRLVADRDSCGVLTLSENYTRRLLEYRHGTSFAAPVLAFKAAALRQAFPDASANLVRALLGLAASHPEPILERAHLLGPRAEYQLSGYGLVELPNALESDDTRPILIAEDHLSVDTFAVYEVPVPLSFQTTGGRRYIRVALAFDPPTRSSRKDYVGIRMGFHLVRGVSDQEVFDHFREWEKQDRDERGEPFRIDSSSWQCKMEPIATLREGGTLQVATFVAHRNLERYGDRYFLIVRCEGGWARTAVDGQNFAVGVELGHDAELPIYQDVSVRVTA